MGDSLNAITTTTTETDSVRARNITRSCTAKRDRISPMAYLEDDSIWEKKRLVSVMRQLKKSLILLKKKFLRRSKEGDCNLVIIRYMATHVLNR